jgi:hypothetical protein
MKVLIVIVGDVLGFECAGEPDKRVWLKAYDASTPDGRGKITTTTVQAEALRFDDLPAAFECWKTTSTTVPLRDDGKPNRPLTAFTITFETVAS